MYVCMYVCVYVYLSIYIYIYIYVNLSLSIYIYIYIYVYNLPIRVQADVRDERLDLAGQERPLLLVAAGQHLYGDLAIISPTLISNRPLFYCYTHIEFRPSGNILVFLFIKSCYLKYSW